MGNAMQSLIDHIYDPPRRCEDPDCELHNPSVAIEEGVADPINLLYFHAGADVMMNHLLITHRLRPEIDVESLVAIARHSIDLKEPLR